MSPDVVCGEPKCCRIRFRPGKAHNAPADLLAALQGKRHIMEKKTKENGKGQKAREKRGRSVKGGKKEREGALNNFFAFLAGGPKFEVTPLRSRRTDCVRC